MPKKRALRADPYSLSNAIVYVHDPDTGITTHVAGSRVPATASGRSNKRQRHQRLQAASGEDADQNVVAGTTPEVRGAWMGLTWAVGVCLPDACDPGN